MKTSLPIYRRIHIYDQRGGCSSRYSVLFIYFERDFRKKKKETETRCISYYNSFKASLAILRPTWWYIYKEIVWFGNLNSSFLLSQNENTQQVAWQFLSSAVCRYSTSSNKSGQTINMVREQLPFFGLGSIIDEVRKVHWLKELKGYAGWRRVYWFYAYWTTQTIQLLYSANASW